MGIYHSVLAVGLLATVTACSPPSFEKPTADLSKGLSETRTAFETLAEDQRKAYIADQVSEGLQPGNRILATGCSRVLSTLPPGTPASTIDCRPSIYYRASNSRKPVEFDAGAAKLLEYGKALDDYGKSLADLGAAKDVAALKGAVSSAIDGVGGIAAAFGGPAGVAAAAGLKVVDVGISFYLDLRRLQELQTIVGAADVSVGGGLDKLVEAATEMQKLVVYKRSIDLGLASEALQRMREAGASQGRLQAAAEALVADHYTLQAYARIDVRESLGKMRQAHAKLLDSIKHPQSTPDAAFKAIADFVKKITDVKDELAKLGAKK